MAGDRLRGHAERFLTAATSHPECRTGRILEVCDSAARLELEVNVEMPLAFRADRISPNGVRSLETISVRLNPQYPWASPMFYLRNDFPRDLPHLQPGPLTEPPRPCLIDGDQREYFFQFGLVELGIFHLLHQLVLWLQRAAEGTLIDHGRGWEPALRRNLSDIVIVNAEACRAIVDRQGGYRVLNARFFRWGADDALIGGGAHALVKVTQEQVPLKRDDMEQFTWRRNDDTARGNTVCCVIWPDKLPNGQQFVSRSYMPETVDTFSRLVERARELHCGRALTAFLDNLERCFQGFVLKGQLTIAVILCARRPAHLIDSHSDIELLPYVFDVRATKGRASLIAGGDGEPVAPARLLDAVNPELLRNVSGALAVAPVAILGCGSVGSKMTMHLARSGVEIPIVSDKGVLLPHNMARHALARSPLGASKAAELAEELAELGQAPKIHEGDLVLDLQRRERRKTILPRRAGFVLNTTASLGVREALSALRAKDVTPRLAEAALFGRGDGAFLLVEGGAHNPTLCDLASELYAAVRDDRLRTLLFDPAYGLTEVQIGQGCGSLTMPMTDMRLSAMTAVLTEELVAAAGITKETGHIIVGTRADQRADTTWCRQSVAPFEVVSICGPDGWALRISQRVLLKIQEEIRRYPSVETGGVMIGTCSARLKAVTVTDLIAAPPDSIRSATRFVLGTEGLKETIRGRHHASGNALFDVGTWHSHLADHGPSALDRQTARELAAERPPPSVLLIVTPASLHALMHTGTDA